MNYTITTCYKLIGLASIVAVAFLALTDINTPALAQSDGVSGKCTDIAARIAGWEEKLNERLTKWDEQLDERIAKLEEELQEDLAEATPVDDVDDPVDEVESGVDEKMMADLAERLAEAEADHLERVSEAVADHAQRVTDLNTRCAM